MWYMGLLEMVRLSCLFFRFFFFFVVVFFGEGGVGVGEWGGVCV